MPASLTYVGHATVLLDLVGGRIVTDPVLRPRVGYLRRIPPVPELGAPVSLILISHVHHDHLDGPSLRRAGVGAPVIAPRGSRSLLLAKGMLGVEELLEGEGHRLGDLTIRATHAEHDVTRLPGGRRVPALGYVIESGPRIYFAGDTDVFDGMAAIGGEGLDVALVPVTGWGPRVPAGHMDPSRAARAVALLRPRVAVPIHWGTLAPMWWRRPGPAAMRAPAEEFAREAARVAPGVEVRILDPGETLALPSAVAPA